MWNRTHLLRALGEYEQFYNEYRTHRSVHAAAPLRALPEPVELDRVRIRGRERLDGIPYPYSTVAQGGQGFWHAQALEAAAVVGAATGVVVGAA